MKESSIGARASGERRFVVATPSRSVCDDNARALEMQGLLRFIALGTRRGTKGVPLERTRLQPSFGLLAYAFAKTFSQYRAESLRAAMLPYFDHWVRRQLEPGDHIISSYGYANSAFEWVRSHGGQTFLDAGNSHVDNFWEIISEEHRRWSSPYPPFSPYWLRRSREIIRLTDFVLSPSSWVTESFVERGFPRERILRNIYPLDLECFTPSKSIRPPDRPLRVICTGQLSLRKGTPYLLEAFKIVLRSEPEARLLLTRSIANTAEPILESFSDLPIDWAPALPHQELAARLQSADIFVLPSLEEGLARTAAEALACGLPVVLTRATGVADFVNLEENGSLVPTRDAEAIAEAILRWWQRLKQKLEPPTRMIDPSIFSFERFSGEFLHQLRQAGVLKETA